MNPIVLATIEESVQGTLAQIQADDRLTIHVIREEKARDAEWDHVFCRLADASIEMGPDGLLYVRTEVQSVRRLFLLTEYMHGLVENRGEVQVKADLSAAALFHEMDLERRMRALDEGTMPTQTFDEYLAELGATE